MLAALLLSLAVAAASVTGTVRDATGAAVPGAAVTIRTATGTEQQTVTGPDGRFTFDDVSETGTVVVRAGGFAELRQPVSSGDMELVLSPARLMETVTVTPNRTEQRLGTTAASVSVLTADQIEESPAVVADDVLRRIPTFSLFRRTSSLSSHPTSQGVSLRGIGPSGVSRTLVLLDGVPFNDPFGGWVYWTRVPTESAERIEVVDGSSSSVYGNYAMGGVINIVSGRATRRTAELRAQYGNLTSPKMDFFASDVWGKLGLAAEGSVFDTTGYPIVAEAERGLVDTKAAVNFWNLNLKADYTVSDRVNVFVRGGFFDEERDNGKVSTFDGTPEGNDSEWQYVSGGVRAGLPDGSELQARVFTDFVTFNNNALAVPAATPPRSVGRISLYQHSPTTGVGSMVQWSRAFGSKHYFSAGTDWRWVDGDSIEDGMDPVRGQTVILHRVAGGTQQSLGAFVQDIFTPIERLTVSARVDYWRNYDGHNLETTVATGQPAPGNVPSFPEESDTVGSPRLAAAYQVNDRVTAWGDLSWGFRAPTLNELYRRFSVGQVQTLNNPGLGPERLHGGELGVSVAATDDVTVRATWFDNRVKDPVANATISQVGANVIQQRQNLGRTRIWGLQTDVEYRLGTEWRLGGGYLYDQATVEENPANPTLVGKFLPQVPEHRGSIQAAYANPRFVNVAFALMFVGRQFDDDLNIRVVPGETEPGLPGFVTADLRITRAITRNLDVYFGVQNLFDELYYVGTLPTTTGTPLLYHGGFRFRFAGR
jgi:iron complex outermembrane recepter protein